MKEKKLFDVSKIIKFIVLYFISIKIYLVQYIPVILFKMTDFSNKNLVILSFFSSLCMAIILFFIYKKDLWKELKIYFKNFWDNLGNGIAYWLLGLVIMIVGNTIIMKFLGGEQAGNEVLVRQLIHGFPLLMLIDAAVLAPFNEELVYRKALKECTNNEWIFAIAAFLIFGFIHIDGNVKVWTDALYIIPYGALGFAFARAYSKTDTVFTSMMMHAFHNFILTIMIIMM